MAAGPDSHVVTIHPYVLNIPVETIRFIGSSSTTRTRAPGNDTFPSSTISRLVEARRIAESFVAQNVLGVIFHLTDGIPDAAAINAMALRVFDDAGIPVVLTDCDVAPYPKRSRYDVVGGDDVDSGYRLTRHLLDSGVRRIAFLLPPFGNISFENRSRGFLAAVGEQPRVQGRVVTGAPENIALVRRLLQKMRVEAVVCGNDRVAAALLETLAALGKRAPDDIRVAGFDDVNFARLVSPSLTTMRLPCTEIGSTAYRTLLARIEHPDLPPRTISLAAPLVVRASTLPVMRRSADVWPLG